VLGIRKVSPEQGRALKFLNDQVHHFAHDTFEPTLLIAAAALAGREAAKPLTGD
jgi:hypothetical protein